MKKLLVLLALAFVMCVPELSYAQSQKQDDVASQLKAISMDLENGGHKLFSISDEFRAMLQRKEGSRIELDAGSEVEKAFMILFHAADLLFCYGDIKPERLQKYWHSYILKTSIQRRSWLAGRLELINLCQRYVKTPAGLYQVNKARDIIRSSLPLFDKAIQILEAKQEKK
jgi:hypothetical protein